MNSHVAPDLIPRRVLFGNSERNFPMVSRDCGPIAEAFLAKCLGGRFEPIGDDLEGSSATVLTGESEAPGLGEHLPIESTEPKAFRED